MLNILHEEARYLESEGYVIAAERMKAAADTIRQLRDDLQRANSDNDKLRELIRDMYFCNDEICIDCEQRDYSGEGFWCKRGLGWKKVRMRELGIEY